MDQRRSMTKLSILAAVVFVFTACSSSSDPAPATGDGGTQGTVCVTVQDSDKIPWNSTTPPTYFCDANKSTRNPDGNACRNAPDCAIIASGQVREITRVCGLSCRSYEPDCAMMAACN